MKQSIIEVLQLHTHIETLLPPPATNMGCMSSKICDGNVFVHLIWIYTFAIIDANTFLRLFHIRQNSMDEQVSIANNSIHAYASAFK